ncbi:hypothetical protein TIFTF001_020641 [Ficus carica]|uniref:Myb-like domain-containing protein n=1 Tax=Ficus carica TaxID=3494 RepID=A0AA88AG49_FICCA|nr:hypothetical protein TIFTF001_020641 [Ficus carica]
MGVTGKGATMLVRVIMDSHPGLDLETEAGIILADHSRLPRVVATQAPDSISYRLDKMCSRYGGDPSREGWPVVGDDRVINNLSRPPRQFGRSLAGGPGEDLFFVSGWFRGEGGRAFMSQVNSGPGPVSFGGVLTRGPGGGLLRSQVGCLSLAMATGAKDMTLGSGFWFSIRWGPPRRRRRQERVGHFLIEDNGSDDSQLQFSEDEEMLITRMFNLVGKRWNLIAGRIPGRTAEEIEKYWNSRYCTSRGN